MRDWNISASNCLSKPGGFTDTCGCESSQCKRLGQVVAELEYNASNELSKPGGFTDTCGWESSQCKRLGQVVAELE